MSKKKQEHDIVLLGQLYHNKHKTKETHYGSFFIQNIVDNIDKFKDLKYIPIKVYPKQGNSSTFLVQALIEKKE